MLTQDRFIIPKPLLPTVMLLAQSPDEAPAIHEPGFSRLLAAGLIDRHGKATTAARAVITVMIDAALVLSIDVEGDSSSTSSTVWASRTAAILGRPLEGDDFELMPIRPTSLPLMLAQLVDVGRRPPPPFAGSLTVTDAALGLALERLSDPGDAALSILTAAGVDPLWADRFLIAHEHVRSRWSISSVWSDLQGSHHVRRIDVLDAGAAGYWKIQPEWHDPPSNRYTIVTLQHVMRLLRTTLPSLDALGD